MNVSCMRGIYEGFLIWNSGGRLFPYAARYTGSAKALSEGGSSARGWLSAGHFLQFVVS